MLDYLSNVDTICILIDIQDYENSAKNVLEYLQVEKEKALLAATSNANYNHLITLNDLSFQLLTNGTKGYSFILHNESYEVKISKYRPKLKNFYPLQVRISSECLWSEGLSNSWSKLFNWITETFGNIIDDKVSRLDLCTHIDNIDFVTNYDEVYKGNFKKTQIFYTGKAINCIAFGTRKGKNVYCRIYNKFIEIQETKKKSWFKEIWKNNDMNIEKVWNLEFELKSEFLRSFKILNVNDVIMYSRNLWEYCTTQWLVKINRTSKRVERCDVDKDWTFIQNAYNNFNSKGLIKRERQLSLDASSLIPNIVGNITSYSARNNNIDIDVAFNNLYKETKRYLENKQTTFETEVNNKIAFISNN